MRAVLQITKESRVSVDGKTVSDCQSGMLVLLGIHRLDTEKEADLLIDRILKLRIFKDENDKLNLSVLKTGGDILVISNFTLYANCSSRRPDFMQAMKFSQAEPLYRYFLETMQKKAAEWQEGDRTVKVFPGVFGADMQVSLINDGPLTVLMDTEDFQ